MTDREPPPPKKGRFRPVSRRILAGLGTILLAILVAVPVLGLLRSGLGVQYAAQLILEFVGPDLFLILVIAALVLGWRWWRNRGRLALATAGLSLLGAIACAITLAGYVAVAGANGVSINLVQALWPRLPGSATPDEAFIYDHFDGRDVRLLVYSPRISSRPAPILVHVHGGGWVQGSAADRAVDDRWFARRGYLVIDADYALSSNRQHLWNVVQPQLGCALAWVAANAPRLGGDPARLALYGESAGGNLVLDLAHLANAGTLPSRCGGQVPTVSAVIAIYPPVDMAALYAHPVSTIYPLAYLGGSPSRYPGRYASVSPISYVSGPGAPTLLLTGLDDSLVPVKDTLRYVALRRASGNEIDLIAIPRAGHGFDALPGSIGNQLVRRSALEFLKTQGLQP